jgi:putative membrane protein
MNGWKNNEPQNGMVFSDSPIASDCLFKNKKIKAMKKTFLKQLQIVPFCLLLLAACSNEPKEAKEVAKDQNEQKFDTKAGEKDAQFVVDASSGSYDEVKIADVAIAKSMNEEVKKLAASLKDDHSMIISDLKKVGEGKAISLPSAASTDAEKEAANLSEKKVKDFDKDWLDKVKSMHEKSIKKYEDASANATDADIKTWAGTTLVKIRSHLDMITQLQDKMKK